MHRTIWILTGSVTLTMLGILPNPILSKLVPDARADSFNAKPGAWEMTFTSQTTGTMIPPDVLNKMPPEQRAKIEQSMKARAAKPITHTSKNCITKEDLNQNRMIKDEHEDEEMQCMTKVISKSSTKLVLERACSAPHPGTSQIAMEATTPESIMGNIDITRTGSGKVHVEFKGRWLSASCAGIKDLK